MFQEREFKGACRVSSKLHLVSLYNGQTLMNDMDRRFFRVNKVLSIKKKFKLAFQELFLLCTKDCKKNPR
jgi:hypothetical protein